RARDPGRAAGASDERVPGRVVVVRDRLAEPAVLLTTLRVRGLPYADRVEVGERRLRISDALDDRELAVVPELLRSAEVLVEPEVLRDRKRLIRLLRKLRPHVAVGLVGERDHGLEAVVTAGELDHDQDLVIDDLLLLRGVHGPCEDIRHRGV